MTKSFFDRQKLFGRHTTDSRWVLERSASRTTWFGSRTNSWRCYRWIWYVESERAKGSRKVTQRQANKATRTHLWVHHDRKTSLPDTSSHAEGFRGKSTASFQYLELGANVSTSTRFDWVAHQVRFSDFSKITQITIVSILTAFWRNYVLSSEKTTLSTVLPTFWSSSFRRCHHRDWKVLMVSFLSLHKQKFVLILGWRTFRFSRCISVQRESWVLLSSCNGISFV